MKAAELRTKTPAELDALRAESTQALREATLSLRGGELQNSRVIAEHRKTIARINTILVEQSNDERKES